MEKFPDTFAEFRESAYASLKYALEEVRGAVPNGLSFADALGGLMYQIADHNDEGPGPPDALYRTWSDVRGELGPDPADDDRHEIYAGPLHDGIANLLFDHDAGRHEYERVGREGRARIAEKAVGWWLDDPNWKSGFAEPETADR